MPVHLFALGDPAAGFFREVDAPHDRARARAASTLEERVFSLAAMQDALASQAGRYGSRARRGLHLGEGGRGDREPPVDGRAPSTTSTTSRPRRWWSASAARSSSLTRSSS